MRALVIQSGRVELKKFHPDAVAAAGEALIQVTAAGICQTDLEIALGYMAFNGVLGHEFVGIVKTCADTKWVGKRVVGEINCVCSKCEMCQRGLSTHCFHRTVVGIMGRDGAFADLLALPVRNLHAVPDHVTDEQAVFTEPLAAALQVLRQVPIDSRTRVAILGDGRLGQLVAQVLQRTGCKPLLVGHHESKLNVAERLGIRTALERDVPVKRDLDLVVDCTGRAEGLEKALALVRPRGTIVLKTTVAAGKPLNLAPLVIDEISVLGSRCGPFPEAISALGQRHVTVDPLITRRVKIANSEGIFTQSTTADALKIVLTFDR